jgi:hypothetical protein
VPAGYPLVLGLAAELPGEEPLDTLRRLTGVRWIVVHLASLTPGERSRWEKAAMPAPVVRFGDDVVYAVTPDTEDWSARYGRPQADTTLAGHPIAILGSADSAEVRWKDPGNLPAGATTPIRVTVRNLGAQRWPALSTDPSRRVALAVGWRPGPSANPPARPIVLPLPRDLAPGETAIVNAVIATPRMPGRYDLVAEVRQGETPLRIAGRDARVAVDVFEPGQTSGRLHVPITSSPCARRLAADVLAADLENIGRSMRDFGVRAYQPPTLPEREPPHSIWSSNNSGQAGLHVSSKGAAGSSSAWR